MSFLEDDIYVDFSVVINKITVQNAMHAVDGLLNWLFLFLR